MASYQKMFPNTDSQILHDGENSLSRHSTTFQPFDYKAIKYQTNISVPKKEH